MKVAIFGKQVDEFFYPVLDRLIVGLREKGIELVFEAAFALFLARRFNREDVITAVFDRQSLSTRGVQFLLSVGGDGTFLDAMSYAKDSGIPILGVNSGRLGFLANVAAAEIEEAVECISTGCYTIEQRRILTLLLDGKSCPGYDYALNEVSVQKTETSSLLKIHAYIGELYLTTYWADGLIVATPTGSTAYSLSGGGPVVSPDCRNIILTPICPHNFNMRPLVVPDSAQIRLQVESRTGDFMLGVDSKVLKIADRSGLKISTGDTKVNVVTLPSHNYYETLRNKLMWGEDRRNERRD